MHSGETMPRSAPPSVPLDAREPGRARWFAGLGRAGFAIVGVAAFVTSLNSITRYAVSEPPLLWLPRFANELVFHALIGLAILLAAVWARNRRPRPGPSQYAAVFASVIAATLVALMLNEAWVTAGFTQMYEGMPLALLFASIATDTFRYALTGLVIAGAWLALCSEAEHRAAIQRCEIDSARLDQQTAEARLQVLEAQIEPHFLFNTLAHVRRLYDTDPARGATMLRDLKDYLAVALPQMRASASTLGRELDHVAAYLGIQQVRMGRRLAYDLAVPAELRSLPMPPLVLVTLVENAIKHGLSPLREGGRIDVRAWRTSSQLHVEVADTGGGFAKSSGGGVGLANIRSRLQTQFGTHASLTLRLREPRGVSATVVLPVSDATP
jgi:signal transduction histidine kinase